MNAERVLFIRLSSLGDVLRTLPTMAAFKSAFPQTTVGFLTSESYAFLRGGLTFVDKFHFWYSGRRSEVIREIRRERYERSYNLHPILRAGLISAMLGIRERYGFGPALDREGGFLFSNHRVNVLPCTHRLDQTVELVKASGASLEPVLRPFALAPNQTPEAVTRLLDREKLGPQPFAVFIPGSSPGATEKRWPHPSYAELGRRLASRFKLSVFVLPGLGETALAAEVMRGTDSAGRVVPELRLEEIASLLSRARMVVGGDTGLTHLANTMGVPSLMIFGPTDPAVYSPRIGKFECLGGRPGAGRPHRGASRRAAPPTSSISVNQAFDACARLLDRTRV
ncbi:MAG: glycosyltransferase family 9 protein [Nitrospirae bacterium]|nr:glycosyltransferase family 9 protein [Nitrospirota bacterium]